MVKESECKPFGINPHFRNKKAYFFDSVLLLIGSGKTISPGELFGEEFIQLECVVKSFSQRAPSLVDHGSLLEPQKKIGCHVVRWITDLTTHF